MRVCIVGAGLSGLSAAFLLTELAQQVDVTIFERGCVLGGRANVTSSGEHCARLFLEDYDYLFRIFRKIVVADGRTLFDSLSPLRRYCDTSTRGWVEISHLYPMLARELPLGEKVRIKRAARQSPLLAEVGSGVNTNRYGSVRNFSAHSIMRILNNFARSKSALTLEGPTDVCLISPWVDHLRSRGVLIKDNTKVEQLRPCAASIAVHLADRVEVFDAAIVTAFCPDAADLLDRSRLEHRLPSLDHIHCKCYTLTLHRAEPVLRRDEAALFARKGLTVVVQPKANRCVVICTTCPSTEEPYVVGQVREMLGLEFDVVDVKARDNLARDEAIYCANTVDPTRILRTPTARLYFAGSFTKNSYVIDSGEAAARSASGAVDRLRKDLM